MAEGLSPVGCGAVLLGEWFLTFQSVLVPLSTGSCSPTILECLTLETQKFFETSETMHPMTLCQIPESLPPTFLAR